MADPLFFDTRDALLQCMRLNVCDGDAADAVIARSIQLAAVELWTELGSGLITTLQAQTYDPVLKRLIQFTMADEAGHHKLGKIAGEWKITDMLMNPMVRSVFQ